MKNSRPLIRRTLSQERFDILIKKQRSGRATFNDLTELDELVNRDPDIRESVLEEMQSEGEPPQPPMPGNDLLNNIKPQGILQRLKTLIDRVFMRPILAVA